MDLPIKVHKNHQSGQALIIILLAMSVALTLVLASVSRSTTDIQITDKEEESLRAFSAAEAGVEQALLEFTKSGGFTSAGHDLTGQTQTETRYEASITTGSVGSSYEHPKKLGPGESATFWFAGHDGNGDLTCGADNSDCTKTNNIQVCFGNYGGSYSVSPAVEIQLFYDDTGTASSPPSSISTGNYSTIKMHTLVYDPVAGRTDDAGTVNTGLCNSTQIPGISGSYAYRLSPPVQLNPLGLCSPNEMCMIAMKIKSLYTADDVPVVVGTANPLPAQGAVINSVGTSGESTRKLNVEYNFSSIPSIFNNTVFSGGGLDKSP